MFNQLQRLRKRLVDVWVQIGIAWSSAAERPVVQGYSVGTGVDEYARIPPPTPQRARLRCRTSTSASIPPVPVQPPSNNLRNY